MVQDVSGFQTLQLVVCAGSVTSGTNLFAAVTTGRTWITVFSDDSHVCSRPLFLRCIKVVVVSFIILLAWKRSDSATCKYFWDWITLMHSRQSSFEALNRTKIIIWFSHRIFKLCFGFKSRFDHWLDLSSVVANSKRTEFVNSQLFLTVLFSWIVLVYTRQLSLNVTVLRRIGFLFFTAM